LKRGGKKEKGEASAIVNNLSKSSRKVDNRREGGRGKRRGKKGGTGTPSL